ncbi:hypothetical protein OG216_35365 [Streptomycetaceae bacterium NBC_01309]
MRTPETRVRSGGGSPLVWCGSNSRSVRFSCYLQDGVPDHVHDFAPALTTGRRAMGPGPHETLVHTGDVDGHPVLTFTGPHRAAEAEPTAPSGRYLLMLIQGLAEAHGWAAAWAAAYLCSLPGAARQWTSVQVTALHEQNPYAIGAYVNGVSPVHMSEEARELLVVAGQVARSRNARELSSRDLALAVVVHRHLQADRDFDGAGSPPSQSPEMLPMAASVARVLTGSPQNPDVAELLGLAARENPDLAEYLTTS